MDLGRDRSARRAAMISQALLDTVGALLADRKGLLAMDESNQQPALELWRGQEENVSRAQQALLQQAENNRLARRGEYEGDGPGHGVR